MTLVIGLSGRIGSGKGTTADYLIKKYGATSRRYSDILSDLLERLHIPADREALQKMGATLRSIFGDDVLVKTMKEDLAKEKSSIVLVDGVRYPNEVEMIRSFKENIIFFVDAPQKTRFERVKKRGEKGEHKIDFEEFQRAERRETEQHLDEIKEMADYQLDNGGTFDDLYQQIDRVLKEHGLQ